MTLDRRAALRSLGWAACIAVVGAASGCANAERTAGATPTPPRATSAPPAPTNVAPPPAAGLPLAVHDAVIGALLPGPDAVVAHHGALERDLALHGDRGGPPVAVLPARNFLRQPTTVAVVSTTGDWSLVLTPARRVLPSRAGADGAPAQSAAWVRAEDLPPLQRASASVTVRVGNQSLTITTPEGPRRHEVGVGQASTPTPTGVSGYLQARFVDPAQSLAPGAIQLTSLHATTADEPYAGTDGGLIAIHTNPNPRGRASHGCIRVRPDVVAQLDTLPLGTPVVILP